MRPRESSPSLATLRDFPIGRIVTPVTICALYTVCLVRILQGNVYNTPGRFLSRTWQQLGFSTREEVTSTVVLSYALLVSMCILALALTTLLILGVFYMEWHGCLKYYFYIPSSIMMLFLTPLFIKELFKALDWFALDLITIGLFVWNFFAFGIMSIFGNYAPAPLCAQQLYLVHNSALLAVVFIFVLPGWAAYLLLSLIVLWDLFAVLSPFGPINMILEMAERKGIVDMPGLVYTARAGENSHTKVTTFNTSRLSLTAESTPISSPDSRATIESENGHAIKVERLTKELAKDASAKEPLIEQQRESQANGQTQPTRETHEGSRSSTLSDYTLEENFSIGLGDFIFFSILVGMTAKGKERADFHATLTSLVAIIMGILITLFILVSMRQPIPALPVSILLGLVVAGITHYCATDLSNRLNNDQLFI